MGQESQRRGFGSVGTSLWWESHFGSLWDQGAFRGGQGRRPESKGGTWSAQSLTHQGHGGRSKGLNGHRRASACRLGLPEEAVRP